MADQFDMFADEPAPRRGEYEVPEAAGPVACRSCGATIVWTRTEAGRPIPLSVATIVRRDGKRWALSHFADCADPNQWSKKR